MQSSYMWKNHVSPWMSPLVSEWLTPETYDCILTFSGQPPLSSMEIIHSHLRIVHKLDLPLPRSCPVSAARYIDRHQRGAIQDILMLGIFLLRYQCHNLNTPHIGSLTSPLVFGLVTMVLRSLHQTAVQDIKFWRAPQTLIRIYSNNSHPCILQRCFITRMQSLDAEKNLVSP